MENNPLNDYFMRRFGKEDPIEYPGSKPFITISREYGCPSKPIAQLLAKMLSQRDNGKNQWEYINKEIVAEAATKINVDPSRLKSFFAAEKQTIVDDLLESFSSKYYKNSKTIQKTIREVVEFYASKGHTIIVGRGGVAITSQFALGTHIRLQAPAKWRVEKICQLRNIDRPQAIKEMEEMDNKRSALIQSFLGKTPDDTIFDLVVNCSRFTIEQVAEIIIYAMVKKGLIN